MAWLVQVLNLLGLWLNDKNWLTEYYLLFAFLSAKYTALLSRFLCLSFK